VKLRTLALTGPVLAACSSAERALDTDDCASRFPQHAQRTTVATASIEHDVSGLSAEALDRPPVEVERRLRSKDLPQPLPRNQTPVVGVLPDKNGLV
jgi:hypothetical protein